MMKKKQSIIALVLAAIVTVLLGWTMIKGWGPTGTGSMKNINLGLDLSGGLRRREKDRNCQRIQKMQRLFQEGVQPVLCTVLLQRRMRGKLLQFHR